MAEKVKKRTEGMKGFSRFHKADLEVPHKRFTTM
jgi:hypothetical protein